MMSGNVNNPLGSVLFLISILVLLVTYYFHSRSDICTKPELTNEKYTFIIVGAGTAGCVLAAKLSKNPNNTVLLIEAGSEFSTISKIPLLAALLQGSSYDWSFLSEPQIWSSTGMIDKRQKIPRGKGIGGSAQINFLVHGQIQLRDLETWELMGAKGFKDAIPAYYDYLISGRRNQRYSYCVSNINSTAKTKRFCRYNKIRKSPIIHTKEMKWKLSTVLEMAVKASGVPNLKFYKSLSTIQNGQRWTTFNSHLKPVKKRRNLHILCCSEVIKILMKNGKVFGVKTISQGIRKRYYANEVILSAGAINTPKLLMLSGIGDETILKTLNIPVVKNIPGVGKNLHDHLNLPLYVSVTEPVTLTFNKILSFNEIFNYIFYRTGIFGKSPIAGIAHIPSNLTITLFGLGTTDEKTFKLIGHYSTETFQKLFPFHSDFRKEGFVFLVSCSQPKSRGYLKLRSHKSDDPPIIDPKYLEDKYDVECTKDALKVVSQIVETEPFKEIGAKIHWPKFKGCEKWRKERNEDDYFECIIRYVAVTGYHPAGTCKMGYENDSQTVIDNNFRVKHINNLRIVDASILPTPVSTFPNSILAAIAEYASDVITSTKQ